MNLDFIRKPVSILCSEDDHKFKISCFCQAIMQHRQVSFIQFIYVHLINGTGHTTILDFEII